MPQKQTKKYIKEELTEEQILEFDRELLAYKNSAELKCDISFYGMPLKSREGWVNNDILGGCHWSLVQYCIDKRIIGYHSHFVDNKWFVVAEFIDKNPMGGSVCLTKEYNSFMKKWTALKNLQDRNLFRFEPDFKERMRKTLEDSRKALSVKFRWN